MGVCLCPLVRKNIVLCVTCFKLIESTVMSDAPKSVSPIYHALTATFSSHLMLNHFQIHEMEMSLCLDILSPYLICILRESFLFLMYWLRVLRAILSLPEHMCLLPVTFVYNKLGSFELGSEFG